MQLVLKTEVKGNYKAVYKRFDQDLFLALQPKFPKLKLILFEGSKTGDKVHIQFVFPKMDWISEITEDQEDGNKAFFIDKGVKLPFGLTFWEHQHIIHKMGEEKSIIEDRITFKSWNKFFSLLLYPILYLSFAQRKPIYKSYFSNLC